MSRAVLFLFVIANSMVYAQYNQASGSVWVFGDSIKLDFNQSPPSVDSDFKFSSTESCASVADCDGNLLFYTNGTQVFNKHQSLMPNGDGLMGDASSTMGTMISPVLGNPDQYYLFVLDGASALNNGPKDKFDGLHYSVIDMSLDNGNGDVVSNKKNIYLTDSLGEKIIGISHENRRDYWVVVRKHFVNEMYAYLITPNGINPNPVISIVNNDYNLFGGVGQMVANHQGNKIAEAVSVPVFPGALSTGLIVYDFDATSGVVSNAEIYEGVSAAGGGNTMFYACAFSPNDQQLYFGSSALTSPNGYIIKQHDMNLWSPTTPAVIHYIPSSVGSAPGHFKNGPDGKIYFAMFMAGTSSGYLHSIEDPNNSINPDIQMNTLNLNYRFAIGLPNTYIHYYQSDETIAGVDHLDVCLGDEVSLGCVECLYYPLNYSWQPTDLVYNYEDSVTNSLPIQSDTIFILEMYSPCGEVINRDTALVNTLDCDFPDIYIPSAFSPNSDGTNDVFYVRGSDLAHFELKIYDRYGVLVYESNDMSAYWDGAYKDKNLSSQVFIYSLYIESQAGHKEKHKGDLTLIR